MALLSVAGLSLSFGGLKAVDDVGFEIGPGEIFTIIGPNGAGKTTVLNILSGVYRASAGAIRFDGRDITRIAPHRLAGLGLARTFQNIELFAASTVLSNVLLGLHAHRRSRLFGELLMTPAVRRQERAFRAAAEQVLAFLGLEAYRDLEVGALPYGLRKKVELARALAVGPKLLLLDEPSSGLNPEETLAMADLVLTAREKYGAAIAMVEHDMKLVSRVSDRVLAMAAGRALIVGTADEVRSDAAVRAAYLGEA